MSGTPRTDAVYDANEKLGWGSVVDVPKGYPPSDPWELLRELEKELATIREQNQALLDALEAAVEQYAGYPPEVLAEIAPEWLDIARKAIERARGE